MILTTLQRLALREVVDLSLLAKNQMNDLAVTHHFEMDYQLPTSVARRLRDTFIKLHEIAVAIEAAPAGSSEVVRLMVGQLKEMGLWSVQTQLQLAKEQVFLTRLYQQGTPEAAWEKTVGLLRDYAVALQADV